jgi:cellulose synthase/poly-beta-1,6-N-acetylglucosamine synthase-like glycosyltransferase
MNRTFLTHWSDGGAIRREDRAAFRDEIRLAHACVGVTLLSIVAFAVEGVVRLLPLLPAAAWGEVAELVVGRSLVGLLLLSGLGYQLVRLGYLKRFLRHRPAPASALERRYRPAGPSLAVLVPSYKEETHVVRQTLLSAALQPIPNRRVVLLIDDPPAPRNREDAARLQAMRRLPGEIGSALVEPSRRFGLALARFEQRQRDAAVDPAREIEELARLLGEAAGELDRLAEDTPVRDHNDALFVRRVLRAPAHAHRARARDLLARPDPAEVDLSTEYRRLAALFAVEVTSFERKRYQNLSHEPNKAMNLNSYIALLGRRFREVESSDGRRLVAAEGPGATLEVPRADFVIVLDADSLLLPDYSLRLLHFMERPENARVAVVQTPYASVPGARSLLERIAGATTDVQLMGHQGSTLYRAGSWVGASATVRHAALEDIALTVEERGHPIRLYVRDRTLSEDTDTTMDLVRRGWVVHNYPDRLAYSATPPDFGALLIQRRRWATGGLIILPNVLRHFLDSPSLGRLKETLLRAQYILGAPLGSIAMLALMLYPSDAIWSAWAVPAFLAWLLAFQRDLRHNGNRASDLLRAVAFNLMLLPINLAGALHAIRQLWTGRKIPFQRTPKVEGRTAVPSAHIAAQVGLVILMGAQATAQLGHGKPQGACFSAAYALAFGYALHAFIGWKAAAADGLGRLLLPATAPGGSAPAPVAPPRGLAALGPGQRSLRLRGGPRVPRARWRMARALTATCLLGLTLSVALLAATQDLSSPAVSRREAAVTFDDLPVASVTLLDTRARREITRKLLDGIALHGVPATGFVNEYGLYGFAREAHGFPNPDGVALLEMWRDAGLELGNHTFAHTDPHATPVAVFEADVRRGETVTRGLLGSRGLGLRYFRHP